MKEEVGSGWAMTWQHIFGDFEQAPKLWTGIKDIFEEIIGPITDARNEMWKFWNENGGRASVIHALHHAFELIRSVVVAISDTFRKIFPKKTGQDLVDLSTKFEKIYDRYTSKSNCIKSIS